MKGATDVQWVETRDAAQCPTVPRTAPGEGMMQPKAVTVPIEAGTPGCKDILSVHVERTTETR